jgi:hypothetical protein
MTFQFNSGPVSHVGAFVNYAPDTYAPGTGTFLIQALDSNGNVLESYDITTLAPISTPNQIDAGAFRGISRSTADIAAFRLLGALNLADNLTFSRAAVTTAPEPSTFAGAATGILMFVGYAWRKRHGPGITA